MHRIFTTSFSSVYPLYVTKAELITGVVCGIRVEEVEDLLMQKIRYLDELAKGKAMDKILRVPKA